MSKKTCEETSVGVAQLRLTPVKSEFRLLTRKQVLLLARRRSRCWCGCQRTATTVVALQHRPGNAADDEMAATGA
jgi:hypothetical protein